MKKHLYSIAAALVCLLSLVKCSPKVDLDPDYSPFVKDAYLTPAGDGAYRLAARLYLGKNLLEPRNYTASTFYYDLSTNEDEARFDVLEQYQDGNESPEKTLKVQIEYPFMGAIRTNFTSRKEMYLGLDADQLAVVYLKADDWNFPRIADAIVARTTGPRRQEIVIDDPGGKIAARARTTVSTYFRIVDKATGQQIKPNVGIHVWYVQSPDEDVTNRPARWVWGWDHPNPSVGMKRLYNDRRTGETRKLLEFNKTVKILWRFVDGQAKVGVNPFNEFYTTHQIVPGKPYKHFRIEVDRQKAGLL
ncbi:hypothetical protein GCM10023189_37770 [Nibrella saemangeumensis]|uniref:DUF4843 domain-containing protein n=1 Tax=Nibrella saemangeumensis TaxID=1084526 RepID=A0ABP8N8U3_9BACT